MSENTPVKAPKEMTLTLGLIGFLVPIGVMIVFILLGVNMTICMLLADVLLCGYGLLLGHKWDTLDDAMCSGVKAVASAAIIMILVGVLVGVFMAAGTIPAMLYYGFKIITPMFFLPVAFLLTCFVALCTGTSWGAVGTIGVVLIGMSTGLNIPLWITAGAIISGAQMGDKMSPLSDTTLLAAASAGTSVFKHVVSMFYTTLPAAVICVVLYFVLGLNNAGDIDKAQIQMLSDGLTSAFNINPLMLVPVIVVLALSVKRVPAFLTFAIGIAVGGVWAMVFQGVNILDVFGYGMSGFVSNTGIESLDSLLSRGGMSGMMEMIIMVLLCGMLSGLLDKLGVLNPIVSAITARVHSVGGIVTATLATAGILAIPGGQYPPLTVPAFAFKSAYDEMDINRAVLSRSMEDLGTLLVAILPWGAAAAYYSGSLGVSPLDYIPYTFLPMLSPLIAVINAWTGIGVFRTTDEVKYRPFWRRPKQ